MEQEAFLHVGLANSQYCTERGWVDLQDLIGTSANA